MWKQYYKKHANRKPRKLLVKAVSFCKNIDRALDLGSGTMIESKFLLKKGFRYVSAVDSSPEARVFARKIKSKDIQFKKISFNKLNLRKNDFDLINAQYSLPFYGRKKLKGFVKKIKNSLKPNGIFSGQFFGVKDSANLPDSKLAFNTKKEVEGFLQGLKVIYLKEEEKDGKTVSGKNRSWHIFHFIAKK